MKKYLSRITGLLLVVILMLSCSIVSTSAAENPNYYDTIESSAKVVYEKGSYDHHYGTSYGYDWWIQQMWINGNIATCFNSSVHSPDSTTATVNKYYLKNNWERSKAFYWYFVSPDSKLPNNAAKYNSSCVTYRDNYEAAMAYIKKNQDYLNGISATSFCHTIVDYIMWGVERPYNGDVWNQQLKIMAKLNKSYDDVPSNVKIFYCYPGGQSYQPIISYEFHPVAKVIKASSSTVTTNGNNNYSFAGIRYMFSKSKTDFDVNGSNYLGYVELDANGEATTDKASRASLKDMNPGTYYVKEFLPSNIAKTCGYLLNETVYTIKVTSENSLSNPAVLRVSDEPVKPTLTIEKYSTNPELTDDNSNYTFDGIKYCLFKSRNSFVTGSSNPDYVGYVKLDADGTGYSYDGSNNTIRNLGAGIYYVKEFSDEALENSGYKLDETVYTVNLTKDYNRDNPYILRVYDEPEGAISAKIIKKSANPELTDGNSCYTLQGAKFNLYENESDAENDTNPFMTDIETDENGVAHISELPIPDESGKKYYVREIVAPQGFALSDEIGELTVSADEEAVNMVEMYDEPQNDPVRILLRKEDEQTGAVGKRLEGAEFTVKYYGDFYTTEEECLSAVPIRTWVIKTSSDGYCRLSDSDEFFVSGDEFYYLPNGDVTLPLGTVYIKESKAPIGYKLSTDAYIQQITSEGVLGRVDTYNAPVIREPRAGVVNISGVKTWRDDDDRDGKRPESLTIDLLRNGEVIDSYTTDESQKWHFEFNDLPEGYGDLLADDDIYYYTYSVKEESISGYTSSGGDLVEVSSATDEWNVTTHYYEVEFVNTYTPEKIKIEGKKIWEDYDDTFGFRPEEVTITLLMNGTPYKTVKTDVSKSWKFSFDNLDKYYNHGELVQYSVREADVDNYTSVIYEDASLSDTPPFFIVNNILKTGKVTLIKVDENDQPLANVRFRLYRESDNKQITCSLSDGTYFFDPDGDEEYVTDANGQIQVEGLPVGDYAFVEIETVEGYMPYPDPIPFSLTEENNALSERLVSVSNHRAMMYNTGGVGNTVFYVVAIVTAIVAATLLLVGIISKRRKKKEQK